VGPRTVSARAGDQPRARPIHAAARAVIAAVAALG
jgi:hypothetical protein